MLIRPFEARDAGAAARLTNHFIEHTAVHFGTVPHTETEFLAMWQGAPATHPWLTAEIDGVFAGYAKSSVWRTREAYAKTAETTIYLESAFHKRGVGTALYSELLMRLRALGFHVAIGVMTIPNEASARLHESLGFRPAGTFHEVGRKFDRWHDTQWWEKIL